MPRLLDPGVRLSCEDGSIVLYRSSWTGSFPRFPVHPVCAVVLTLLDGERAPAEVAEMIGEVFSFDPATATRTVDLTLSKYRRFLVSPQDLGGRSPRAYDPADFLIPYQADGLYPRETVPQYIWWRVSRFCNRRCKYCCVAASHAEEAPDAAISFPRLRELFEEGADIGVRGVSMGGGEPFIRPDLVDVVELLLALEYEVDIDTKFALPEDKIERLARAGLPTLHVSLDSPYAHTANYLVGDPEYFGGITRSMGSLIDAGVEVTVTSVLTEINALELPELLGFLDDMGVRKLTLNTFSRYYGSCRYNEEFELSEGTRQWLRDTLPELERRYRGRLALTYDRNFAPDLTAPSCGAPAVESHLPMDLHCDQGIRVLRMLPDGRVSRCDQWWFEEDVIFGDLNHQSIWDVWSSPQLAELLAPPRERFAQTACGDCGIFDLCNSTGRCIFAAHEAHGTVYAPDDHCARKEVAP